MNYAYLWAVLFALACLLAAGWHYAPRMRGWVSAKAKAAWDGFIGLMGIEK